MSNIDFKKISKSNLPLLRSFLSKLSPELKNFRYYLKRDLSVIKNHLSTILLYVGDAAVGYGHLDQEDGRVWLGIVVRQSAQGKGYGQMIVKELITQAKMAKVAEIFLTVDNDNSPAESLYKKFGFVLKSAEDHHKLYSLKLKDQ